jgi:anti-sigma factor RsiW
MSQDPNKFDPKETTEAKLCAYVDGELDAAGRAEIEKYLETNPQHRKLMEELKQTRDLMRALPRGSAPPEIGEMLQGQLERSLLLNELDAEPAADSMRISRAAQFRAVAAVILLALGLGAVVYFVLPSSNQRVTVVTAPPMEHEIATNTTQIVPEMEDLSASRVLTAAAAPGASGPMLAEAPKGDPFARADADNSRTPAEKAEAAVARRESKGGDISGGLVPFSAKAVGSAQQSDPFRARVQQTLANVTQGQSPANYTCVVVSCPDPAATKQRVNTFLVSNKIQWQPVAEPMPQPIQFAPSQVAMTSKLNQTQVRLKQYDQVARGQNRVYSNSGVASNGEPLSPGTQLLANNLSTTAPAANSYAIQSATAPSGEDALALDQKTPVQQPVQQQMKQQAAQRVTTDESNVGQAVQPLDLHGVEQAEDTDQYIVARNMTHEQTAQLKDLLAREGGSGTVEVFNASTDQPLATTQSLALIDRAKDTAAENKPASLNNAGGLFGGGGGGAPATEPANVTGDTEVVAAPTSAPAATTASVPATQLLAMQKKLWRDTTTQPTGLIDGQFNLQPTTNLTQDVVIVLRNDASNAQVQAQVAAPAPTTSAAPIAPPAPVNAAPAALPATAPATTQAAP